MRTIREHLEIILRLAHEMMNSPAAMGARDIDRLYDLLEETEAALKFIDNEASL